MRITRRIPPRKVRPGEFHRRWIMFEGSLVESRGLVVSKMQKWSAVGSVAVQCAVAAVLIAIPMVRPEMMPVNVAPPQITVPTIKPVQLAQQVATNAVGAATAITLPGHT